MRNIETGQRPGMLTILWFYFWRAWFAFACWMLGVLTKSGAPDWLINWGARLCGTGYAFSMCRLVGWSGRPYR